MWIILSAFVLFFIVARIIIWLSTKNGITLSIRNLTVTIQQGDIFKAEGWKLIPFNEFFDTQVDDIIIAHNTLNGIFIDNYIDDVDALQQKLAPGRATTGERIQHQLGSIKTYGDYLLLAFTHFTPQYEAHLSWSEYERCLRHMWQEISRVYANKPLFLPLLGGGVTRFDDKTEKSEIELLKCILCTLRTSKVHINTPITILLTKDVIQKINLYELKGVK